ncbi:hypothetical protein NM688_g6595 [Phlebia brevispora]|uniref:Uncharacterized protein n=1 Tax=Phlebia brevispora TaxID=194682 RepID=A0ACC1SE83_9APHY|nr:hypothetical protein NM688_g6595 [Phlebia brevispora]
MAARLCGDLCIDLSADVSNALTSFSTSGGPQGVRSDIKLYPSDTSRLIRYASISIGILQNTKILRPTFTRPAGSELICTRDIAAPSATKNATEFCFICTSVVSSSPLSPTIEVIYRTQFGDASETAPWPNFPLFTSFVFSPWSRASSNAMVAALSAVDSDTYKGSYDHDRQLSPRLWIAIMETAITSKTTTLSLICEQREGYIKSAEHRHVTVDRRSAIEAYDYIKVTTKPKKCGRRKQISPLAQDTADPNNDLKGNHSSAAAAYMTQRRTVIIAEAAVDTLSGAGDAFKDLYQGMTEVIAKLSVLCENFNYGYFVELPWITTLTLLDDDATVE